MSTIIVKPDTDNKPLDHKFLGAEQIAMIDEALLSIGEYGEVRLVVEKGRLRFLITQKSFDTMKWQPGSLEIRSRNTP
jgi:hypothetical protein